MIFRIPVKFDRNPIFIMKYIDKEILRLSFPAIVSNVTVPLLGLCDTAISGHLGSEKYLAAIAVGSVMLNVVFWLFGFLRAGTTGLAANAFGAGEDMAVRQVFSRALALALSGGVLIILIRTPLSAVLVYVIDPDPDVTCFVARYFSICIWGAPAILGTMALSGWFVGMQSTVYPMAVAVIVNVINILLSFFFVFVLRLGFEGVAWGTLSANWIGLLIAFMFAVRFRKGKLIFCSAYEIFKGGGLGKFFSVNANLFVRSACIICVSLGIASAGARLGALTLAVNVIVMQFFQFFSFFMDGFAFSAEALVGRYAGCEDEKMLRSTVSALLKWTLVVSAVFFALYFSGCGIISSILTDQEDVRKGIVALRVWICLIPPVSAWAFIYDGFYVGVTDTRKMMWATMFSTIVFYIIAFIRYDSGGLRIGISDNTILWSAFLTYLFLRGVILACRWKRVSRQRVSRQKEVNQ